MSGHPLTGRAESIAAQEDFGAYRCTYPVNRGHDRRMRSAMLVLLFAPTLLLPMAYRSPTTGTLIAGLIFLALALILAVPLLIRTLPTRHAQVHVFERGAIAERPRGVLYSWPYRRATARYVCWRESNDGQWRDRPQLWITFHRDGETICFDGLHPKDRAVLPQIAREFGISDQPEQVDGIVRNTAPTPL